MENTPYASKLPFSSVTYAQMKEACNGKHLRELDWRVDADGMPRDGNIGRLLVRMPNPELDVVVQMNFGESRSNFHVFPAADWRYSDQPTTCKLAGVFDPLTDALRQKLRVARSDYSLRLILDDVAKMTSNQPPVRTGERPSAWRELFEPTAVTQEKPQQHRR